MQLEPLMGRFMFLGSERLSEAIYQYFNVRYKFTELEKCVLLRYLGMQIPNEAKRAFASADDLVRKDAIKTVMARFPREWPPP